MSNFVRHAALLCLMPLIFTATAMIALAADETKTPKTKDKGKEAVPVALTPEREQGALAFVERHHPELTALLTELKTHKEKQYERAVRELAVVRERLEGMQSRDAALYELELASWKIKSRVQLLTAKLSMKDQSASKEELRKALEEQYDLRKKIARHERDSLAERLKKLDHDMAEAETRRDAAIQKQFDSLISAFSGEKRSKEGDTRKNLP